MKRPHIGRDTSDKKWNDASLHMSGAVVGTYLVHTIQNLHKSKPPFQWNHKMYAETPEV